MISENHYDVTTWPIGDAHEDIGAVINSIIDDIKKRQSSTNGDLGKPGAVIDIPVGDFHLKTQVRIDISYLKIEGSGHGFVSSSIRYNTPKEDWGTLHEVWPGGSRILVDLEPSPDGDERDGAAFYVERDGDPRISSVEFSNFCIDGLHFTGDDENRQDPENTYLNGKTGIYIASAQDSFRINDMGFVYLEHGVTIYDADALSIHDNFIAECGNCIELRGSGQASKITDNLIGAGYRGYSMYAQNFGGLLISGNNVFPRGASTICFDGVIRSSITGNRLHAFYPGMIELRHGSSENLIAANHLYRTTEPWPPMKRYDNGLDDRHGLIRVDGSNNSIIANHVSASLNAADIKPQGAKPVIIRLVEGNGNYIASNHLLALTQGISESGDDNDQSCFSAQVESTLSNKAATTVPTINIQVDGASAANTILDSATADQAVVDTSKNAFRPLPAVPTI
ncbi:right-handed parallel beta-helix repeat-containing protein [Bifidobacterium sp. ESL0775]|uniref:NosD domain-containing protein n=1 Tax=Bifidobacterium sp. ESL0775 TaxID=2983230 RepID=UPI0023F8D6F6|nr:right-handed parallel beta-helix repeat-containing protein [Bifidobacterium sp. ESL0775]WEV69076.1 right-handed parallel beta-helix repeat-containing protein [Bifidobacterium sp. ESL0775]